MLPNMSDKAWPPAWYEPAMDEYARCDRWLRGDIDAPDVSVVTERGIFTKTITRTVNPDMVHVPLPADIATASADLLFSEAPRFVLPLSGGVEREKLQARTEDLFGVGFHSKLLAGAEIASGLGGIFYTASWDLKFSDRPIIQTVHADQAVPTFRYGQLVELVVWRELADLNDSFTYRHLERFYRGGVEHAVYQGDSGRLGQRIPVQEHPDTAWLAESLNSDSVIESGVDELLACYVPNMLPQKLWRNTPQLQHLGRSDFTEITHVFRSADQVMASWLRDVRLAKGRIIAPRDFLHIEGNGRGASFDYDREVYELAAPALGENQSITSVQFAIRVEEHKNTLHALQEQALRRAGLSEGSFGTGQDGLMTATAVKARERLSNRTRDKKARHWAAAFSRFSRAVINLDLHLAGLPQVEEAPEVRFSDEAQADIESLARTASMLKAANLVSLTTAVRMVHPEWDGETVNSEVKALQEQVDQGRSLTAAVSQLTD